MVRWLRIGKRVVDADLLPRQVLACVRHATLTPSQQLMKMAVTKWRENDERKES